nr:MAG TPA: hypothetical protein [Caudoviricetes sp.]
MEINAIGSAIATYEVEEIVWFSNNIFYIINRKLL